MWNWEDQVPDTPFSELLKVRGVDHRGEEIHVARAFNWLSIAGALPHEVGSLELGAFCIGGCKHYVGNFEEYLLPVEQQTIGRPPRVMVSDEDWGEVCSGLISSRVYHVHGQPLVNGLFSVSKNEVVDNVELHRLIMNLIPINRLVRSLQGDTGTLPSVAQFNPFYLEDSEVAILGSEDIRCFYYLFQLPESWYRFMAFSKPVPSSLVPDCWKHEVCYLHSRVLPMGFVNNVGLAQHIHRNVAR